MTMTDASEARSLPDHRADVFATQGWVAQLLDGVSVEQHHAPTPCAEFDVEALVKHLYGVTDRVTAAGEGRDPVSVELYADPLPADPAAGFRQRAAQSRAAWADASGLGRVLQAPWGPAPAAIILAVYVAENLAHGWDLAVATGQPSEADPALAEAGLQVMRRALPAEGRDEFPFDDPVEPAADAGPTERLANWLGRSRP